MVTGDRGPYSDHGAGDAVGSLRRMHRRCQKAEVLAATFESWYRESESRGEKATIRILELQRIIEAQRAELLALVRQNRELLDAMGGEASPPRFSLEIDGEEVD